MADGSITQVIDHHAGACPSAVPVPATGFVLAGPGGARTWLLAHAAVGARAEIFTVASRPGLAAVP